MGVGKMMRTKWRNMLWMGCLILIIPTGCSLMSSEKFSSLPFMDKTKVPDRIVAVWEPAVSHDEEKGAERGFGGRVMFFQNKSHEPVKVDGMVVVNAFDETARAANDTRPDKKYVFTPDQLEMLYSKSDLGHSYNFWLPWSEVEAPEKEISLIVRFSPTAGSTIVSKQSTIKLPGLEDAETAAGVRQASWDEKEDRTSLQSTAFEKNFRENPHESWDVEVQKAEITESRTNLKEMKTTTIEVPPTFRAHRKPQAYVPLRERIENARRHHKISGSPTGSERMPTEPNAVAMESPRDSESHFLPRPRRAPGAPIARPKGDGAGRQPRPLMWRSDSPSSP
jgi:hypothetical protein